MASASLMQSALEIARPGLRPNRCRIVRSLAAMLVQVHRQPGRQRHDRLLPSSPRAAMIITKRGNVVSSLLLAAILACAHSGSRPTVSPPVPDQGALPSGTNSQSQSNGIIGNGESQSQSLLRGCPGGNGFHISVNTGTANDSSSLTSSDSSSLLNAVV